MRHRLPPFIGVLAALFVSLGLVGCDTFKSPSGPKEADKHGAAFQVTACRNAIPIIGAEVAATFDGPEIVRFVSGSDPAGWTEIKDVFQDDAPKVATVIVRAPGQGQNGLSYLDFRGTVELVPARHPREDRVVRVGAPCLELAPFPAPGGDR